MGTLTYVKENLTRTYDLWFMTVYTCPLNLPSSSPSPNPRGNGMSPTVPTWAIAVMATQGAVIVGLVSGDDCRHACLPQKPEEDIL